MAGKTSATPQVASEMLAVALDVASLDEARRLIGRLGRGPGWLKVGAQLFTAAGPPALAEAGRHARVFLDTKLHDIPNTVAGAVRAAVGQGVDMLTLHACGGVAMLRAARDAAGDAADRLGRPPPRLLAVTVLTSLEDADLAALGIAGPVAAQVERLVDVALEAGLDGVVASPREIAAVRRRAGADFWIVTPGVRAPDDAPDDQARAASCQEAVRAGADVLVMGRPILRAADPARATAGVLAAIRDALEARPA